MRKPCVFVSSTCYDLKEVRAQIRDYLDGAGFETALSEYSSFPIDPDTGTIENCLRAVKDRADIFVLVIGGRYGSVTADGRSITNLEYVTARAKHIPTYVFVQKSILDILSIWQTNRNADFSYVTDSPKVFEFVHEISASTEVWMFPFDLAQEIVDTLRVQLAYLFSDALNLRKQASGVRSLRRYENISGEEFRIIIEKPSFWEHRLLSLSIQREFHECLEVKRDWEYDIALGLNRRLGTAEFLTWLSDRIAETQRLAKNMRQLLEVALRSALGPFGVAGDADHILYVASRFGAIYRAILQWRLDFGRIDVAEPLRRLRSLAAALLDDAVKDSEDFVTLVRTTMANLPRTVEAGTTRIELTLTFRIPDQTELNREIETIRAHIANGLIEHP